MLNAPIRYQVERIVKPRETLCLIALRYYGYKSCWQEIYSHLRQKQND